MDIVFVYSDHWASNLMLLQHYILILLQRERKKIGGLPRSSQMAGGYQRLITNSDRNRFGNERITFSSSRWSLVLDTHSVVLEICVTLYQKWRQYLYISRGDQRGCVVKRPKITESLANATITNAFAATFHTGTWQSEHSREREKIFSYVIHEEADQLQGNWKLYSKKKSHRLRKAIGTP